MGYEMLANAIRKMIDTNPELRKEKEGVFLEIVIDALNDVLTAYMMRKEELDNEEDEE